MTIKFLVVSFIFLIFAGCASSIERPDNSFGDNPIPTGSYKEALNHWSASEKTYVGGAQALQITATLLARDVLEHQVFMDAQKFHWTADQYRENRQKALYDNESATSFFVVLYTDKDAENN